MYSEDASDQPRFPGVTANSLKCFEVALGNDVMVQLGTATQRPTFWFADNATHSLSQLQREGITLERIHEVVG